MGLILCLETATTNCSVGIAKDGGILSIREDNSKGYSHAEKLHIFIQECLQEANLEMKDLDAVAVSKGPGSYTGLRIGVSAAKGIAFSIDIPLLSVPTLEVLAHVVKNPEGLIIPMIDARRMEVYAEVYDVDFNSLQKTKAVVLEESSFQQFLDSQIVHFVGNGVSKFEEICKHPNARFHTSAFPSVKEMAALAEIKYKKSDTEDVAYFEPYYLKDFVAG